MEIAIRDVTDVEFSETRRSLKQPVHTGFGFVIHLPREAFNKVDKNRIEGLLKVGMKIENRRPVFLRSDMPYVRLTFNYGAEIIAKSAYALMSAHTVKVYRNWF